MASSILVVLLLAAGIQVSLQQTCHMKDMQACALKLKEFADKYPARFPANKEQLDEQCEILTSVRDCVYNYSRKCVSELVRTVGVMVMASTGESMKEFCTPGSGPNTKYLEHAKCITDNFAGVTPCLKTALASLEAIPKMPWNDRLPGLCCAVGRVRTCASSYLESQCSDVSDLVEMVLSFAMTDILSETCKTIENAVSCPDLPPPGTPLDGSHKNNLLGDVLSSFIIE